MSEKKQDDYIVLFKGAKLSKRLANQVGLGLITGLVGGGILLVSGITNRAVQVVVILCFVSVGFWLGNKIFKK